MDNQTTMYVVLGLLAIFFIVLMIFSWKSWRALHLIMAVLVFLAACTFVFFAAATLRTHQAWREVKNRLAAKIEEQEATLAKLRAGDRSKVEEEEISLIKAEGELLRVLLDRGRVWRGCTATAGANAISVTIPSGDGPPPGEAPADGAAPPPADGAAPPADGAAPPADGAAPPAAAPGRHNIEADNIVYAFLEGQSEIEGEMKGLTVPVAYLGEFKVTGRTDTTVTLQPTIPLTPQQEAAMREGTWTLYDTLPIDSHYAFEDFTEEQLRSLFPRERMGVSDAEYNERITQLTKFFDGMTPAQLAERIPKSSVVMSDSDYDAFIQRYVRDGKEANVESDPPDRVWKKVTFLKPHVVEVDVAAEADAGPAVFSQENFNARGLAVNEHLRQGGPTEFEIGDTAIFDPKTAEKLIAEGVVDKETEDIYVRQLHDFKMAFDEAYQQTNQFEDMALVIKADTAVLLSANTRATAQIEYRTAEGAKLKHDLAGFTAERDAITRLGSQLNSQMASVRQQLSSIYRANIQLAERIRTMQLKAAEDVNRAAPVGEPAAPAAPGPSATSAALTSP